LLSVLSVGCGGFGISSFLFFSRRSVDIYMCILLGGRKKIEVCIYLLTVTNNGGDSCLERLK
jgi:hypothetical protein